MKTYTIFAMLLLCSLIPGLPACTNMCLKAMPVVTAGQAYVSDAQIALDQAQVLLNGAPIPADKKALIQVGIDKAQAGLRAADSLLAAASSACNTPDMNVIFKEFLAAWSSLKGLFGANVGVGLFGAAPGAGIRVVDPAIYRKAGGT